MGADHARIFANDLTGTTVQVVCDASVARARAIADETGAVDVATDALATIRRADVDAVIIASPDPTHAPLAQACMAVMCIMCMPRTPACTRRCRPPGDAQPAVRLCTAGNLTPG